MTQLAYPSGLSSSFASLDLSEVAKLLRPRVSRGFSDLKIHGLAFHSAEVRPGNLFFAIRGTQQNGSRFAARALQNGAVAIVAEQPLEVTCPVLVVDDARKALADVACLFYGHPSRRMRVVGVTGTNGKTTVAHLIRACLEADRRVTGLLGTIGYEFGGRRLPAANTTPDPLRLQGYLREMVDRGCHVCVAEVSSHGLVQERVRGVQFHTALFLNLSREHLDYHQSMQDYALAKARLFASLEPGAHACISLDSEASSHMFEALHPGVEVHTFGANPDAELRIENVCCTLEGTRFEMVLPHGRVELMLHIPGLHNAHNALAAASAAWALGVSELTIASALEEARAVRGRLQQVGERDGVRVFVDYAHTHEALTKVCKTLHDLASGRLIVVFGCGGDRDRSKRPLMARAVASFADEAYLTSDNPRSEDPERILDEMERGLDQTRSCRLFRIVDRGEAIRAAIAAASPGDTVLIAGKGHETCQIMADSVVPFDDRLVAQAALAASEGIE